MTETQLATVQNQPRPSALAVMATKFNVDPAKLLDTLKNTAFRGATDQQCLALCIVANEMDLNPFLREIYAFPDKKTSGIIPVVGVDGWYKRINAHSQFDGMIQTFREGPDGKPISCCTTMFRKDRKHPTEHTEWFNECYRNTDNWNSMPHRMLGHRGAIQAARKAFGFSGMDPEDAERMREKEVKGSVVPAAKPQLFSAPQGEITNVRIDHVQPKQSALAELDAKLEASGISEEKFREWLDSDGYPTDIGQDDAKVLLEHWPEIERFCKGPELTVVQ